MRDFLDMLSPSLKDNAYIMYRVMDRRDGRLWPVKAFWSDKWPMKVDPTREYFFSPVLRNFGKSSPVIGSVLWFDFDGAQLPVTLPLEASCLVSSGYGWHAYYRLSENYLAEDLARFVSALAVVLGSDPASVDAARFMRLPGSYNLKGSSPVECRIMSLSSSFRVYSLDEVSHAYGLSLRPSLG